MKSIKYHGKTIVHLGRGKYFIRSPLGGESFDSLKDAKKWVRDDEPQTYFAKGWKD